MLGDNASSGILGLIAGAGELPIVFAKAATSLRRPLMVFGIEGYTDRRIEGLSSQAHYVGLGELGRLIQLLKEKGIRQVVLAGAVPKKRIYEPDFKMDVDAQSLFGGLRNKGDDHLLRAFGVFLKARCGVSVMDPRVLLKSSLSPKGVLTKRAPTDAQWRDLRLGYKVAKHVGKMDIGQTVVIKDTVVLAVEAVEGTDKAIVRGAELGHGGTVVVKTAKPNQDLRFDLPCVGTETLETLKKASSHVLGVEAGKTILILKEKLIEKADKENMTLVGL